MKILQVVHYFPPAFHAGAENYAYNLGKELGRRHEVSVYCRGAPTAHGPLTYRDEPFEGMQVRRIFCPQPETFIRSFYNEDIHDNFKSYLREVGPDVVHVQHLAHLSTSCIDEVVRMGIPLVLTLHDYFFICPQVQMMKPGLRMCPGPQGGINCLGCDHSLLKNFKGEWGSLSDKPAPRPLLLRLIRALLPRHPIARLKTRFFSEYYPVGEFPYRRAFSFMRLQYMLSRINKADLIIAPSSYLGRKYREAGVDGKNIIVSSYGMNHALFESFEKKMKGERIRFSFIGTLNAVKGVHVLIEAFNRLPAGSAELNIFGDLDHTPPYTAFLRQLAQHPNIRFRGRFSPSQVSEPYSETDVLVIPSLWHENCPLVLHDAFIAKTPVIVSRGVAMDEFVHEGKDGLLFERGDSDELAEKMMLFIRQPGLIEQMGRQAPKVKTTEEDALDMEQRYGSILTKRLG